jgi:putative hydrolase
MDPVEALDRIAFLLERSRAPAYRVRLPYRRPERLDPPRRLLRRAVDAGVLFSVDTDAHAPGRLDWQIHGCARAEECGVPPERVVTTWTGQELPARTRERRTPSGVAGT